jgi:hypothetical protein
MRHITRAQVNGNRVELGDVESALRASPLVAAAAARLVEGRLCGYCVLSPAAAAELQGEADEAASGM